MLGHMYVCVCVFGAEYMIVSLAERRFAVSTLTSIVLLSTNRMMIEMKLICADNKDNLIEASYTL